MRVQSEKEKFMKNKTLTGIRRNVNPMFVSVASTKGKNITLQAYNDSEQGIFFVAQASAKEVFSPITGKKVEALSIGEIATSADFFAQSLKVVGKCKCGCEQSTTADIASLLTENKETSIHCTACGEKMELSSLEKADESEENEDETVEEEVVEDDESVDDLDEDSEDEDVDLDDDSEDTDEDVSDEDEDVSEDEEEIDEEVEALLKEASEAEAAGEDEDLDAEVAKLIAEVAAEDEDEEVEEEVVDETTDDSDSEEEMSSTVISHPLHRLVDRKSGKVNILFVNNEQAMLRIEKSDAVVQIGTFYKVHAKAESAKLYDRREVFGKVAVKAIEEGALDQINPSETLSDLGFKPIQVDLPVSVATEQEIKKAVADAETKANETASTKLTDVSSNYSKLVTVAALGLDKGAIKGNVSLFKDLTALLESAGVRNADVVARKFCETKIKPFFAGVIEKANELAAQDPAYVKGVADSVESAQYIMTAKTDIPEISTATHDSVVASLDDARDRRATPKPNLQALLGSLGRRGLR